MQGVLVAQLFRLQRPAGPVNRLSFHEVGVPLSVACHCVAVIVAFIGAFRFWKQQNAMARGKIYSGGWELNSVGAFLFMVRYIPRWFHYRVTLANTHLDYCGDLGAHSHHSHPD